MEPLKHRYIVVEGPIGVGKTTLTRALARRFNARSVFEIVEENPFLASFYQDRNKFAFQTQLFFLLSRFKQQQELFQQDLFSQITVSDYLFAKDRIFASITLDPNELALYERIYEHLGPRVMKPDLVIYLQASVHTLIQRVKRRGHAMESGIDEEYLRRLSDAYTRYFYEYNESPLLIVNSERLNFVDSPEHLDLLVERMDAMRGGREFFNRA